MMKNVLVVNRETLVNRFRESMMDYFRDMQSDLSSEELAVDLESFVLRLRNLSSPSQETAFQEFKATFREGFTMMLLDSESFEQLEKWYANEEKFTVVLAMESGLAFGVLSQDQLVW